MVLKNARRERFAQAIAAGKTVFEAYSAAGYKADDGNASKMANRPEITGRVQEITGAAAERAGVTCEQIIRELALLGFANMLDFIKVGDDGQPYTDFSALTRDQAAAIGEVIVETRTEYEMVGGERQGVPVRKVKFKLADKRGPLTDLGKHLGMFKERIEHSGVVAVDVSDTDRAKALAAFIAKTKGAKGS